MNAVKQMHYAGLTREEKQQELQVDQPLGMEYVQVRQWWEELEWDLYSWNKYEDPPATNEKDWYGLNEDEKYTSSQLCNSFSRDFCTAPKLRKPARHNPHLSFDPNFYHTIVPAGITSYT